MPTRFKNWRNCKNGRGINRADAQQYSDKILPEKSVVHVFNLAKHLYHSRYYES